MNRKKQLSVSLFSLMLLVVFVFSACAPAAEAVVDEAPADASALEALPLEVSVSEAAELREQGYFVLDVREPEEWEAGHIPGATLIPLGELETRFTELPSDQPILVYCRSGNRSAVGRDFLLGQNFPAVTSMAGGMNQWISAGYEVETGQ